MTSNEAAQRSWSFSLFEAIMQRRSRRFPLGAEIGGLAPFRSDHAPVPLDEIEEALLALAANGLTGATLPDDLIGGGLDYTLHFAGRTFSSPCGSHGTHLMMSNDDGVFLIRPLDMPRQPLAQGSLCDRLIAAYRQSSIKLSGSRVDIPMSAPTTLVSNRWDLNRAGTSLFMPVTDVTREYINLLFMMMEPPNCAYLYDDLNGNAEPLKKYLAPGKLNRANALSLSAFEQDVLQCTASTEQALMLQNIFLATQAIGLGGWLLSPSDVQVVLGGTDQAEGLGFRFVDPLRRGPIPPPDFVNPARIPVGLDGHIEACCPPYFSTMAEAVQSVYDAKWGSHGSYANSPTMLTETKMSRTQATKTSEWCVDATADLCTYIWDTYGRFPARLAPMQMSTWFQAHHLETAYYDQYYRVGSYHEAIRDHFSQWHPLSNGL